MKNKKLTDAATCAEAAPKITLEELNLAAEHIDKFRKTKQEIDEHTLKTYGFRIETGYNIETGNQTFCIYNRAGENITREYAVQTGLIKDKE
jgi:hypothetical protein